MPRAKTAAVWVSPSKLTPWAENPRDNDHAVDRVAASIKRFGFGAPILARKADGRIIAGHTRHKAAQRLGMLMVPVRYLDISEAEATALALADNRLGELADWREPDLAKILHDLQQDQQTIDDLGWTQDEVDGLLSQLSEVAGHTRRPAGDPEEDDGPPPPVVPGSARLFLGDCYHLLHDLDDNSIDSVVTDPPYGLSAPPDPVAVLSAWLAGGEYDHNKPGFMGNEWDAFVPGPHVWREVYRVLKPGGHAVVFAGTRTVDLMGIALRLAGFEIRDCGEWCYWSGFPKSVDMSKALDKRNDNRGDILKITGWIRSARDASGMTNRQIDEAFDLVGMASHWTSKKSQPTIPTPDQWIKLVDLLGAAPPQEIAGLFERLTARKGQPGDAWFDRKVVGEEVNVDGKKVRPGMPRAALDTPTKRVAQTTAASAEAQAWMGWGTGLKPAHEPWILVRKPVELSDMSIADNLLRWGTGAINIDATRFPDGDDMWPGPGGEQDEDRFPANLVQCKKPSRTEKEAGCEHLPGISGAEAVGRKEGSAGTQSPRAGAGRTADSVKNHHPTVKPLRLMAWLVRLVTPPGGVVLDPFMGSGTTGAAAVGQGFRFVGMDLEESHVRIAEARIAHWSPENLADIIR